MLLSSVGTGVPPTKLDIERLGNPVQLVEDPEQEPESLECPLVRRIVGVMAPWGIHQFLPPRLAVTQSFLNHRQELRVDERIQVVLGLGMFPRQLDRKSTRLNSSH